jgi:DNA-binding NtrC family response regulator
MSEKRASILVVDEEGDMAESLRRILARAGHSVELASDAELALARIEREAFDLVVTDLRPSIPSGRAVLEGARRKRRHLPVIVVSGAGAPDLGLAVLRDGAADYVQKPFTPEELLFRVERALAVEQVAEENDRLRGRVGSPRDG